MFTIECMRLGKKSLANIQLTIYFYVEFIDD